MNKRFRSLGAWMLSLLVMFSSFAPYVYAADDPEVYHIKTADDLVEISKNCSLDSWSEGKTVILDNDIDLTGSSFISIPSFSGNFNGDGNVISGFEVTDACSPCGFFGVITESGSVTGLTVKGNIEPAGEGNVCGAIAGQNYGSISSCTFRGNVKGNIKVGGIAGINEVSGTITKCEAHGSILGLEMTGGIAGYNLGVIKNCNNYAYVNISVTDPGLSLEDLDVSNIYDLETSSEDDSANVTKDTGGIAGYSSGMILGCNNHSTVGYKRVGYNCGGIAGRSSGYISDSTNMGTIFARKDAGGIVGQAEPYVVSSPSESSLKNIQNELHILNNMLNNATYDYDNGTSSISSAFAQLNDSVDEACDNGQELTDSLKDNWNTNMKEVNRASDIIDTAIGKLADVTEELEKASDDIHDGMNYIGKADTEANTAYGGSSAREDLATAMSKALSASTKITSGSETIGAAIDAYTSTGSAITVKQMLTELNKGVDDITDGFRDLSVATSKLESGYTKLDEHSIPYVRKAIDEFESASLYLDNAITYTNNLVEYLDGVEEIQFVTIGSSITEKSDAFYDSLNEIAADLDNLNSVSKSASDILSADIRKINDQFTKVMDLIVEAVLGAADGSVDMKDTSEENINKQIYGKVQSCSNFGTVAADINVGGIAGTVAIEQDFDPEGNTAEVLSAYNEAFELKAILQNCTNTASVVSHKNCCGSLCGRLDLGTVISCQAYGNAESENGDYVGGITGLCSGSIRDCFVKASLSGNNYVGGIIGSAQDVSTVDSSSRVSGCYSFVNIERCSQYSGAVAGVNDGEFSGNYFVSDELAGINRVSYSGKAEPLSYAEMLEVQELPYRFRHLTVSFVADGTLIKTISFKYGESVPESEYPDIPKKENNNASWDRENLDNLKFDTVVTAVYTPYVTAIASEETRDNGRPIFFVSGSFSSEDALMLTTGDGKFESDKLIEEWKLIIPDDGSPTHQVRFLSDQSALLTEFYINEGTGWEKLDPETIGSYICFEAEGSEISLAIVYKASPKWVFIGLGIAGAAAIVMILSIIRRKRKSSVDK